MVDKNGTVQADNRDEADDTPAHAAAETGLEPETEIAADDAGATAMAERASRSRH